MGRGGGGGGGESVNENLYLNKSFYIPFFKLTHHYKVPPPHLLWVHQSCLKHIQNPLAYKLRVICFLRFK